MSHSKVINAWALIGLSANYNNFDTNGERLPFNNIIAQGNNGITTDGGNIITLPQSSKPYFAQAELSFDTFNVDGFVNFRIFEVGVGNLPGGFGNKIRLNTAIGQAGQSLSIVYIDASAGAVQIAIDRISGSASVRVLQGLSYLAIWQ